MLRKLVLANLLTALILLTVASVQAQGSENQALLRLIQLANDQTTVSLTLQDGRTVLTNLASGSVSDYLPYVVNRSTLITLSISPPGRPTFTRQWTVPPLTPGYHTAALVGGSADNTLDMIFVDEDDLCAGKLATGSCVITINNIKASPPLTLNVGSIALLDDLRYRQAVVGAVTAGSYLSFTAVDPANPQPPLFRLQRGFFEPNVIYFYSFIGSYSGRAVSNFSVGTVKRVPVDSMTFLRGLTANLNLSDGTTLFATENIVAILEMSGLDQVLSNEQLPLTVFVPTDGAVLETAADLYACAITNPSAMRALILNHILAGTYTPSQLIAAGAIGTMAGETHTFRPTQGGFSIDNTVNVPTSQWYPTLNGSVYLIDHVLVPDGFADRYCAQG